MARCTAPVLGHRTASGRAACPACGGTYGYSSYGSYPSYPSYPSYSSSGSSRSSGGGSGSSVKPRWSRAGSSVVYTPTEVRALTPIRESVEKRASLPDLRDLFLCHAWDDRQGAAKELHDALESRGVSVWFSEKDVGLGTPLLRAIDKGLAKSRIGIVLVTPALLRRLPAEGIADKELSALRARDQLVPVVHETTYEALREVSPLLASRSGLSTAEEFDGERCGQARRASRPLAFPDADFRYGLKAAPPLLQKSRIMPKSPLILKGLFVAELMCKNMPSFYERPKLRSRRNPQSFPSRNLH